MNLLLDSFWRAAAYCLHPRVIALSFLPLVLMVALALGLGYFFWDASVDAVRAMLDASALVSTVTGWLQTAGVPRLKEAIAPLLVIFTVTPLLVILSLLVVAVLMTPAMVSLVVQRRFASLERKRGGSLAGSLLWSLGSTLLALVAMLVSMPLWLVPPLILLLPPLIWGWLTYRVLAYDALADHASQDERRELFRRHRGWLLVIGVVSGFLGAAPNLLWVSFALAATAFVILLPLAMWIYTLVFAFSSLWFAHYCLAALERLRSEDLKLNILEVSAKSEYHATNFVATTISGDLSPQLPHEPDTSPKPEPARFGLVIVGDEILSGKRADKHMAKVIELLAARGLALDWAEYVGDSPERITATLVRAFASGEVVFSTGGIGATPDDHTRQCAARALGRDLALHPQAEALIRERMQDTAREQGTVYEPDRPDNIHRLNMGVFPVGASIIPNPYNKIPGFSVGHVHFVPGFPVMAWPMVEWVLDTHYAQLFQHSAWVEKSVIVFGSMEATLTPLMQELEARFAGVKVFSLPSVDHPEYGRHIELGVKGTPEQVADAYPALLSGLQPFQLRLGPELVR